MERRFKPSLSELATYTSKMDVVEFVNALGTWGGTPLSTQRQQIVSSTMVVTSVHSSAMMLKKVLEETLPENIYCALVEYCREKNIQLGRLRNGI